MALSDLFQGTKHGMDMYFQPEHEATDLAKKRLGLLGLEQQYADDMYLKPLELAEKMAKYEYNTALANANTSSLAKLRPLQDTNTAAALTLDTSKLGTSQQIQNATSGTQVAAGIADARNKLFGATNVTPSEQQKQIAGNVYSTQDYGIKAEIGGKTRGDTVKAAVLNADTNRGTAEVNNQENQFTVDYFKQNPDIVKNVALDKIATAITTGQTTRINSADQKYLAQLTPVKRELLKQMAQAKAANQPVDAILNNALSSNNQIQSDAAASVLQDMQKADTGMKIEQLKASGRDNQSNAQAIKQQRIIVAGNILNMTPAQLSQWFSQKYGIALTQQQDGTFKDNNGISYSEDKIRQIAAQENNALNELLDLSIKKNRLENGGNMPFVFNFGGKDD